MPTVDFYILNSGDEQARLHYACKLAAKAYAQRQPLYIHCNDQAMALSLDDLLWSFDDTSFIPHGLFNDTEHTELPVLLGWADIPENRTILLNLHADAANTDSFERILEIVGTDAKCKQQCRQHYKAYQALDFPLKSHHV